MKKLSFKKAFSPIELSIVILIIGILIAGVTQSSRLIRQAKLKTAQTLTSGADGVTTWYDINPQSSSKNNATFCKFRKQPRIHFAKLFHNQRLANPSI